MSRSSISTSAMLSALVVALLADRSLADRTFTVKNDCDFTLWPAVANYPQPATDSAPASASYSGLRGWEAKPGSQKDIQIPELWNGRIWARRDCEQQGDKLHCIVGQSYDSLLDPGNDAMGDTNMGEWNLVGWSNQEFYDLSSVPGYGTPISLVPSDPSCKSATCKADLNSACPKELSVKDDKGATIACLSACMAKQGDLAVNCCSGEYNNRERCTADKIDYYKFFKDGCANAYAYPFDDTTGSGPDVVFACPVASKSGYTLTFCPDGAGAGSSPVVEANADPPSTDPATRTPELVAIDDETTSTTEKGATKPSPSPTGASAGSSLTSGGKTDEVTQAHARTSVTTGETNGATAVASMTKVTSLGAPSNSASAPSASGTTSESEEEILGVKPMTLATVGGGGVLALVIIGLLVWLCVRKKHQSADTAQGSMAAASLSHGPRSRRAAAAAPYSSEGSTGEESSGDEEEQKLMRQASRSSASQSRR